MHHRFNNVGSKLKRGARCVRRDGLTLFEVVLSLAIFVGALAAIGQLLWTGSQAALQARFRSEAVLRAESKMSDLVAGVDTLQSVSGQPFEDGAEGWTWTATVEPGPHPDLLLVVLTVTHSNQATAANASYTLSRYVRDPQIFVDAAAAQPTGGQ